MYSISQRFDGSYPPEAAAWCNRNSAVMVQVEGGYEIQTAPEPEPVETPSVTISSDTITIPDAELLVAAAGGGDKTAEWLIEKLEL